MQAKALRYRLFLFCRYIHFREHISRKMNSICSRFARTRYAFATLKLDILSRCDNSILYQFFSLLTYIALGDVCKNISSATAHIERVSVYRKSVMADLYRCVVSFKAQREFLSYHTQYLQFIILAGVAEFLPVCVLVEPEGAGAVLRYAYAEFKKAAESIDALRI